MSLAEVWPWWVEEEEFMGIIQLQGPLVNRRAGTGSTGKISLPSTIHSMRCLFHNLEVWNLSEIKWLNSRTKIRTMGHENELQKFPKSIILFAAKVLVDYLQPMITILTQPSLHSDYILATF